MLSGFYCRVLVYFCFWHVVVIVRFVSTNQSQQQKQQQIENETKPLSCVCIVYVNQPTQLLKLHLSDPTSMRGQGYGDNHSVTTGELIRLSIVQWSEQKAKDFDSCVQKFWCERSRIGFSALFRRGTKEVSVYKQQRYKLGKNRLK
jgi:hypothetical protein